LIEAFKTLALDNKTQVILTTHSSNIVKQLKFSNLRLINCTENNKKEILGVIPGQLNYPSLNEVNYVAFGEATEEYHDELYSYIEFQGWIEDYRVGKEKRLYKKIQKNGIVVDQQITLTEYIRHQIHHPENTKNNRFTNKELKESISLMREFIQSKRLNNTNEGRIRKAEAFL